VDASLEDHCQMSIFLSLRNRASTKAWPDQTETIRELIFRKRYAVLLLLLEMRDHFIPIFLKVFKPGRIDEIDLNASDLDHP
jgi:hypothetical protein